MDAVSKDFPGASLSLSLSLMLMLVSKLMLLLSLMLFLPLLLMLLLLLLLLLELLCDTLTYHSLRGFSQGTHNSSHSLCSSTM